MPSAIPVLALRQWRPNLARKFLLHSTLRALLAKDFSNVRARPIPARHRRIRRAIGFAKKRRWTKFFRRARRRRWFHRRKFRAREQSFIAPRYFAVLLCHIATSP